MRILQLDGDESSETLFETKFFAGGGVSWRGDKIGVDANDCPVDWTCWKGPLTTGLIDDIEVETLHDDKIGD